MSSGVLLVLPPPETLKAKATWIVARNWLSGVEQLFDRVHLATPRGEVDRQSLAAIINAPSPARHQAGGLHQVVPPMARTAVRDAAAWWRRRAFVADAAIDIASGVDIRFVWQHHSLFFRTGEQCAQRLNAPLVQLVEALQVWEAQRWGVIRPGWGAILERMGEVPQLRSADVVACVSSEVAEAVQRLGVPEWRIAVTPNVADPSRFRPGENGVERKKLGLDREHFVIGWTGSFRKFHGLHGLVRVFADVAVQRPLARLLLVGDGQERPAVEALIRELRLQDKVLLPGEVAYDDVPAFVRTMDVGVISTRMEDFASFHYSPLKLREYLACGVPAIAPSIGEISRHFSDRSGVITYPPGDQGAFTAELLRLTADRHATRALADSTGDGAAMEGGLAKPVKLVLERLEQVRGRAGV